MINVMIMDEPAGCWLMMNRCMMARGTGDSDVGWGSGWAQAAGYYLHQYIIRCVFKSSKYVGTVVCGNDTGWSVDMLDWGYMRHRDMRHGDMGYGIWDMDVDYGYEVERWRGGEREQSVLTNTLESKSNKH
ncbi:hypothetical protein C8Q74DRAFT_1289695 [Fomes fomentarius]|nr:hypothetical protein C8Q74DRAFT_1289695 [Fomes fomentarius]